MVYFGPLFTKLLRPQPWLKTKLRLYLTPPPPLYYYALFIISVRVVSVWVVIF